MATTTNNPSDIGLPNNWVDPANAYLDDTNYATAAMIAKNTSKSGIWTTFGITPPTGSPVITKVEIGTKHKLDTVASIIATMGREISWDAGTSWGSHTLAEAETETTTEVEKWIEVTADTAWTWAKLNDANLQVRITCFQGNDATAFTMSLNVIWVRVTYYTRIYPGDPANFTAQGLTVKPGGWPAASLDQPRKTFRMRFGSNAARPAQGIVVKPGGYKDSATGALVQPRKSFWARFGGNADRPKEGIRVKDEGLSVQSITAPIVLALTQALTTALNLVKKTVTGGLWFPQLTPYWFPVHDDVTNYHGFGVVHSTYIQECNLTINGQNRKYLAFDSTSTRNAVRLLYTDDLDSGWTLYGYVTFDSGTVFRTSTVALVAGTLHMFVSDWAGHIKRYTSTDGINWTLAETVLTSTETEVALDPHIWLNPNDNKWYLYWWNRNVTDFKYYVRSNSDITALAGESDTIIYRMTDNNVDALGFCSLTYFDDHYWLLLEHYNDTQNKWQIIFLTSNSPTGPFLRCSNTVASSSITGAIGVANEDIACGTIFLKDATTGYVFYDQNLSWWYPRVRKIYFDSKALNGAADVGSNSWTDPSNAYGTTRDASYATAAPSQGGNVTGEWKGYDFDTSIPADASILSVEVLPDFYVSSPVGSVLYVRVSWDNGGSWSDWQEDRSQPASITLKSFDFTDATPWTRTKLLDANLLVEVKAFRGESAGVVTFYLDRVMVRVIWKPMNQILKLSSNRLPVTPRTYPDARILHYKLDDVESLTEVNFMAYGTWSDGLVGDVVDVEGRIIRAGEFDGAISSISKGAPSSTGWYGDFGRRKLRSFAFWIKASDINAGADQTVFCAPGVWSTASNANVAVLMDANDKVGLYYSDGVNTRTRYSTSALVYGVWTHVALVREDTGEISVYVDGHLNQDAESGAATNTPDTTPSAFYFGTQTGKTPYLWAGVLDEFRIWKRPLTAAEVLELFNRDGGHLRKCEAELTVTERLVKFLAMTFGNADRPAQGITVTAPVSGWPSFAGSKWFRTFVQKIEMGLKNYESEDFESYAPGTSNITGWTGSDLTYEVANAVTTPDGSQYLDIYPSSTTEFLGRLFHNLADAGSKIRLKFFARCNNISVAVLAVRIDSGTYLEDSLIVEMSSVGITVQGDGGAVVISPCSDDTWYGFLVDIDYSAFPNVTWKAAAKENAIPDTTEYSGDAVTGVSGARLTLNPQLRYHFYFDFWQELEGNGEGPNLIKKFWMILGGNADRPKQGMTVSDRLLKKFSGVSKQGLTVTDNISKRSFWKVIARGLTVYAVKKPMLKISQAITVGNNAIKHFWMRFTKENADRREMSLTVTDRLMKKFTRSIDQGMDVEDNLFKGFQRKLSQGLTVAAENIFSVWKRISQEITFTLPPLFEWVVTIAKTGVITKALSQAIRITAVRQPLLKIGQALRVAGNVLKYLRRPISQPLRVTATWQPYYKIAQGFKVAGAVLKRFTKVSGQELRITAIYTTGAQALYKLLAQGIEVVVTWQPYLKMSQALKVVGNLQKSMASRLSQGLTVSDRLVRRFARAIAQALTVASTLSKRGFFKVIAQSLDVEEQLAGRWVKSFAQSLNVSADITKQFRRVLSQSATITAVGQFFGIARITLSQGIAFLDNLFVEGKIYKAIVEALRVTATWQPYLKISQALRITANHLMRTSWLRALIQYLHVGSVPAKETEDFESYAIDESSIAGWTTSGASYAVKDDVVTPDPTQYLRMYPDGALKFSGHTYHALAETVNATNPKQRFRFYVMSSGLTVGGTVVWFDNSGSGDYATYIDMSYYGGMEVGGATPVKILPSCANNTWYGILLELDRSANTWKASAAEGRIPEWTSYSGSFINNVDVDRVHFNPENRVYHYVDYWQQLRLEAEGPKVIKHFTKVSRGTIAVTDRLSRSFKQVLSQAVTITDTVGWVKYKILALTQGLTAAFNWFWRNPWARLVQGLTVTSLNITDVTFTILSLTPLAGTFPRPARIATFTLRVERETTGDPLSGVIVNVVLYTPTGAVYKTLSLTESTHTVGLYSANFKIKGSDALGSYPFTATAVYGLSTGTYDGFITIFQGPLAGIHYR